MIATASPFFLLIDCVLLRQCVVDCSAIAGLAMSALENRSVDNYKSCANVALQDQCAYRHVEVVFLCDA